MGTDNYNRRPRTRLLLVEDDEDLREMLESALKQREYEVYSAGTADVAAIYLRAGLFDILVTDVETGSRATGLNLAEKVARFVPPLPTVIMSGKLTPPANKLQPHQRFLRKPFLTHQLILTVDRLLNQK